MNIIKKKPQDWEPMNIANFWNWQSQNPQSQNEYFTSMVGEGLVSLLRCLIRLWAHMRLLVAFRPVLRPPLAVTSDVLVLLTGVLIVALLPSLESQRRVYIVNMLAGLGLHIFLLGLTKGIFRRHRPPFDLQRSSRCGRQHSIVSSK